MSGFEVAVLVAVGGILVALMCAVVLLTLLGEHLKDLKAYTMTVIDLLGKIEEHGRPIKVDLRRMGGQP